MKLEVLHVPDCPNAALLNERLGQALGGDRARIEPDERVIDDARVAADAGMTGSPTLLIDGTDPFAEPGREPSLSCRLYPDERGGLDGAPSVAALRDAIATASEPSAARTALDTWQVRAAPADPAERRLHQAILRSFATSGGPPSRDELDRLAAAGGSTAQRLLTSLHEADVIRLDATGTIRVAYPFSAVPTRHLVELAGGATVHAMCAVDALGIPAMLGTDVVITSSDPAGGEPITVTSRAGRLHARPGGIAVFVGAHPCTDAAADCCCEQVNFFTDRAAARTWAAEQGLAGEILDLAGGAELGRKIFGTLLDRSAGTA